MAAIKKTTPKVHQDKEVRSYLDRMETDMIEELRHGNIFKVFANSKFKVSDFQTFFANQWKSLKGGVIQDEEIMAMKASFYGPNINQFKTHSKSMTLSQQQRDLFNQEMSSFIMQQGAGVKAKGTKVVGLKVGGGVVSEDKAEAKKAEEVATAIPEEGATVSDEGQMPDEMMGMEELQGMADGTLGDWDAFLDDAWMQIMDAQMMSDYRTRMAEIQKEVDRIIALAKSGKIGAEFVLIALAKVNATKNGVLISGLGRKASGINESLNKVAEDLNALDPSSPSYLGEAQLAQSRSRDKNFQLNLITQDMQKVSQDIASVMDQVHGMISEMNRVRREIIQKVAARG
ncbi:MAG: hypothetical protein HN337_00865 [Deltaproteobacteria bacterium]|jgi:hypothetical protein|nr:hypothetical protein [Deltaproteobacteria bacterium]